VGIDTAGDIVGIYLSGAFYQGFLLSGGTYTAVDYPGSGESLVSGINDKGQVVRSSYFVGVGFVYDTQTQTYTEINYPGAIFTQPYAINDAATIVGSLNYTPTSGFWLDVSGRGHLFAVPGADVLFNGISATGEVVGYYILNGRYVNFTIKAGKAQRLAIPNAPGAVVQGINPAGTALVGYYNLPSTGFPVGFIYENGTVTTVQFPGAIETFVDGINAVGEVVGVFKEPSTFIEHGFTWTPPADAPKK
jgi:uncharacterized membrane protein